MKLNVKYFTYLMIDIICAGAAFILATLLRFDFVFSDSVEYIRTLSPLCLFFLALLPVFSIILGTYRSLYVNLAFRDVLRQAEISFFSGAIVLLIRLIPGVEISKSVVVITAFLFFILTVAVRGIEFLYRLLLFSKKTHSSGAKRVIIVGAGSAGSALIHMLKMRPDMRLNPVVVLDDDKAKCKMVLSGVPVYGTIEKAAEAAAKYHADEIIIAIPSADSDQLKEIFNKCKNADLPVKTFGSLVDFSDFVSGAKNSLKNLTIEDLLFRDSIKTDMSTVSEYISGKTVLVTGGAGSIGSEICRQALEYGCKYLVIMDINENGLFFLRNDLLEKYGEDRFCVRVGSVRDKVRMDYLFKRHKFDIVFHAAAHKHVPLMEDNIFEAVKNNVFGTKNTIECCIENKTSRFVLISTDKAVNPTNIMGATKRVAELIVQRYSGRGCELSAVRFGNVLGSNGSVIPIFRRQIEAGGPVTVTHRDIMRYFMTIPEAVSLVMNAGVSANGGEIFVLDMGEPVSIYDLACNMIELAGLKLGKDINIEFTGLRPGEKMFEELKLDSESYTKTNHNKIFIMHTEEVTDKVDSDIDRLENLINSDCGESALRSAIFETISIDYASSAERGRDLSAFSGIK